MGFFDKARNAAIATKLKGEILLQERNIKSRQSTFGVEFYDLMVAVEKRKVLGTDNIAPSVFHKKSSPVKQYYDDAKAEITEMAQSKEFKEREIDVIEVKMEQTTLATTAGEKAKNAGTWIQRSGKETQLFAEIKLLDRKIRARKEKFGVDVYEHAITPHDEVDPEVKGAKRASKSLKNALTGSLRNMSTFAEQKTSGVVVKTEKDIRECVEKAKTDIERIERSINIKRQEIESLSTS